MTPDEAIKKFEKIKKGNIFLIHQRVEGKEVFEDYSLCDIAISALEKQVPKKPLKFFVNQSGDLVKQCICGQFVSNHASYCENCGQMIKR